MSCRPGVLALRGILIAIAVALPPVIGCGDDDGGAERDAGHDGGAKDAATPDGGGAACPLPDEGLYATFSVNGELFRAKLTGNMAIDRAIALWRGTSNASIPNGELVCEPSPWNCGYGFHLEPGTIEFAEVTIEVCDGAPSFVDANCEDFVDRYCPWGAELVQLRDCRQNPACPVVPRAQ